MFSLGFASAVQAVASMTAGVSTLSLNALTNVVEHTKQGQALLAQAHRDSAYRAAPPGSPLYQRIVNATGGTAHSPLVRPYLTDHKILGLYLDTDSRLPEQQNLGHVNRILMLADRAAMLTGLTHAELRALRRAMAYSDVAKHMPWTNSKNGFQKHMAPFARFENPSSVGANLSPHPVLDGIADWLKWYQQATGKPLHLRPLSETGGTASTARAQKIWGVEPFEMHTNVGQGLSDKDRFQALRFFKIVFNGETPFKPTGLLFHEIPGYALAYANREPLDVLLGILFHNGPTKTMRTTRPGQRLSYEDGTAPYWATLTGSLLFNGYPFVVENHLQAILHNISDRWEQGGLFEVDGELVGGLRKILGDRLMFFDEPPLASVIEVLKKVPEDSLGQIHAIWHHRVTSFRLRYKLFPFYKAAVEALGENQDLIQYIDLAKSTAYKIVFRDGSEIEIPHDVLPESTHKLTEAATDQFLRDFFAHIKILKV